MPPKKKDEKQKPDTGFIRGISEIVPVLQLGYSVVFPSSTIPLALEHDDETPQFLAFLKEAPYCIAQPATQDGGDGGFPIGVLGRVTRLNEGNPDEPAFYFSGLYRVQVTRVESRNGVLMAKHELLADIHVSAEDAASEKLGSLLSMFRNRFHLMFVLFMQKALGEHARVFFELPFVQDAMARVQHADAENLASVIDGIMNMLNHADMVLGGKSVSVRDPSLLILAEPNVLIRVKYCMNLLDLLFQAAASKKSGSLDEPDEETDALEARYEEIKEKISEEARKEIEKEFSRMRHAHPSEASVAQDHVELLIGLPWGIYTEDPPDLRSVRHILDEDHAELEKVKERILEYLAVRQLNPAAKSRTLCFVGPPGVGKTSLGESIARALGRKFINMSLGGMHDEAELRGHRKTYIGAGAGLILEHMKRAGSANPVFMLDEGDKIGKDFRGDPSAALLSILDPKQNVKFFDWYAKVHFNLSRVLFIVTANIMETILPALLDRFEILELPGYTTRQKLNIAKRHLIARRRKEDGFPIIKDGKEPIDLVFADDALLEMIEQYAREAGVRGLEDIIDMPFRKIAKMVQSGDETVTGIIEITKDSLERYCGKPDHIEHKIPDVLPIGVVPVLAVSDTGGHLFEIEVGIKHHSGSRKITMNGVRDSSQTKDTINKIEESLKIAFDALACEGGILAEYVYEKEREFGPLLITGNLTNGAVPKDGPSAGVSALFALYGALTRQSIKPTKETPLLAATGEITMNLGTTRAIGGIRDKILAARRRGVQRVIIPKENENKIEDIPPEILLEMEVKPMQSMLEALAYAYPHDERIRRFIELQHQ